MQSVNFRIVRNLWIGSALVWVASACGGSEKLPGNTAAYEQGSPNCSWVFLHEYNDLISAANTWKTSSDVISVRGHALQFGKKYAGVTCVAPVGGQNETIDVAARMQELIEAGTRLLGRE